MIPVEGFGPVVTFCSFVVMIRVVWARVVIEGIWGCYVVLRSKVLSLSWSLRNVKLLIFQEHLRTWYAQTIGKYTPEEGQKTRLPESTCDIRE